MKQLIIGIIAGALIASGTLVFAQTTSNSDSSSSGTTAVDGLLNRITALEKRVSALETCSSLGGRWQTGGACAVQTTGTTQPGPQPTLGTGSTVQTGGGTTVSQGASGQNVQTIQQFLKDEGSFTYSTATGYYGPITTDAVKTFQAKNGLTVSGTVDQQTIQKMNTMVKQVAPTLQNSIQSLTTEMAPAN